MKQNNDLTVIDLFCGAGGLTSGFEWENFSSLCAIDINPDSLTTYKHNFPDAQIICDDVQKIDPKDLRLSLGLKKQQLSAIIGGPPCQGFSRNVPAGYRYLNDPQNLLYITYIKFVREFKPKYVVIENVPEILNAYQGIVKNEITKLLESMGYKVTIMSLNAAFYGVPQTRKRAFFVGCLYGNEIETPKQTHYGNVKNLNTTNNQLSIDNTLKSLVTVREAIGDLPPLEAGDEYPKKKYPQKADSAYQKLLRDNSKTLPE